MQRLEAALQLANAQKVPEQADTPQLRQAQHTQHCPTKHALQMLGLLQQWEMGTLTPHHIHQTAQRWKVGRLTTPGFHDLTGPSQAIDVGIPNPPGVVMAPGQMQAADVQMEATKVSSSCIKICPSMGIGQICAMVFRMTTL